VVFKFSEFLRDEAAALISAPPPPRVSLPPTPHAPHADSACAEEGGGEWGAEEGGGQGAGMLSAFEDEDLRRLSISSTQKRHADGYGSIPFVHFFCECLCAFA
jgi:hypothetical protein